MGVFTTAIAMVMRTASAVIATTLACVAAKAPTASQMRGAYFGCLVADALTLGSHYEYDAVKIKKAYGGKDIDRFLAPGEMMGGETHGVGWGARNYHPGTKAGDQTDYGEYNVLVLEHLAATAEPPRPFSVEEFLPRWEQRLTQGWKQWVCSQTRRAYQVHQQGGGIDNLGGPSNAMALRYAAAFSYYDDEGALVDAAKKSMFTHGEQTAQDGAEFFARLTFRVMRGTELEQAVREVAKESSPFVQQKVDQAFQKVKEATDPSTELSKEEFVDDLALTSMARLWDVGKSEPIKVGKASPTEGTLPGSLYFILKYRNLRTAAVRNAMVGGDNASRAVAIGMVLGAMQGLEGIPEEWQSSLNHWQSSEPLLAKLPLLKSA